MINKAPQKPSPLAGQPSSPNRPRLPRWAEILIMLFAAGLIGGAAGLLSRAAGDNLPAAILAGGGAYAAAVGLLLAVAHYAQDDRQ